MFSLTEPTAASINRFIASQRELPFSYSETGATQAKLPGGYTHDHNRARLGNGRDVFHRGVTALRHWQQFDLGWVRVVPDDAPLRPGTTVAVKAHTLGIWTLNAARVVYVVNETGDVNRFGFAYGTLPDHVECGEERFLIEWDREDDSVWYDILAFSKPRHRIVRVSHPYARWLQKRFAKDSLGRILASIS